MPYSIIIRSAPRTAKSPCIYAIPLWLCNLRSDLSSCFTDSWSWPREQGNVFTLWDSAGFSSTPFTVVKVPFCMKAHVSCLISVKLPSKQSLILYTKLRKLEPAHILLQLSVLCFLFDFFFFNLTVYDEITFILKLEMQFLPQRTSTFDAILK